MPIYINKISLTVRERKRKRVRERKGERKSVRERKEERERGEKEAGRELRGRVGFNQTRPYQRSRPSNFDLLPFIFFSFLSFFCLKP